MAKKRTRKQKQKTQLKQQLATSVSDAHDSMFFDVSIVDDGSTPKALKTPKKFSTPTINLFDYNPKLLLADLKKTVFLSTLVIGSEVGLFIYLTFIL